jgi:hypothetical protein
MIIQVKWEQIVSKNKILFKKSNDSFQRAFLKILLLLLSFLIPLGFSQILWAADVRLVWDANTEPNLAGYRVYYGTAPRTYGPPINLGNVTSHTLTGFTAGQTYFFAVTAYNSLNQESDYSMEAAAVIQNLRTGWNLISAPALMSSSAIIDFLSPLSGLYEKVYAYVSSDSADPWKMFDPVAPSYMNDLQSINSGMGIWIKMRQNAEFLLPGMFPSSSTIPLSTGWNLISYKGSRSRPVTEALSSISGKYEKVYAYVSSDSADPWKMFDPAAPSYMNDLNVMVPGLGYWIKVKENCSLVVNN